LEIGVFEGGLSVSDKFSRRRRRPTPTIFARIKAIDRVTTLMLTVFTQRKFVADLLREKCTIRLKRTFCVFEPHLPSGGLKVAYAVHLSLI